MRIKAAELNYKIQASSTVWNTKLPWLLLFSTSRKKGMEKAPSITVYAMRFLVVNAIGESPSRYIIRMVYLFP